MSSLEWPITTRRLLIFRSACREARIINFVLVSLTTGRGRETKQNFALNRIVAGQLGGPHIEI